MFLQIYSYNNVRFLLINKLFSKPLEVVERSKMYIKFRFHLRDYEKVKDIIQVFKEEDDLAYEFEGSVCEDFVYYEELYGK